MAEVVVAHESETIREAIRRLCADAGYAVHAVGRRAARRWRRSSGARRRWCSTWRCPAVHAYEVVEEVQAARARDARRAGGVDLQPHRLQAAADVALRRRRLRRAAPHPRRAAGQAGAAHRAGAARGRAAAAARDDARGGARSATPASGGCVARRSRSPARCREHDRARRAAGAAHRRRHRALQRRRARRGRSPRPRAGARGAAARSISRKGACLFDLRVPAEVRRTRDFIGEALAEIRQQRRVGADGDEPLARRGAPRPAPATKRRSAAARWRAWPRRERGRSGRGARFPRARRWAIRAGACARRRRRARRRSAIRSWRRRCWRRRSPSRRTSGGATRSSRRWSGSAAQAVPALIGRSTSGPSIASSSSTRSGSSAICARGAALAPLVDDDDANVRVAAAEALGRIGGTAARAALAAGARARRAPAVAGGARGAQPPRRVAADRRARAAPDDADAARGRARGARAHRRSLPVLGVIGAALDDPARSTRDAAIRALAELYRRLDPVGREAVSAEVAVASRRAAGADRRRCSRPRSARSATRRCCSASSSGPRRRGRSCSRSAIASCARRRCRR